MIYRGSVPVKVTRYDVLAIRYDTRPAVCLLCFFIGFVTWWCACCVRCISTCVCVLWSVWCIVLKYTVTCDPDAHRLHFSLYVSSLLHVRYGEYLHRAPWLTE